MMSSDSRVNAECYFTYSLVSNLYSTVAYSFLVLIYFEGPYSSSIGRFVVNRTGGYSPCVGLAVTSTDNGVLLSVAVLLLVVVVVAM